MIAHQCHAESASVSVVTCVLPVKEVSRTVGQKQPTAETQLMEIP